MLDKDLAEIYGYEVKRLNEQVKRNISRFPEDFMFQLNREEIPEGFSKSQFATLNEKSNRQGSNIKKMPFAFTEQGIYMLATVLRGELAEQQSIFIMRTFREMRHYIKQNQQFVTRSEMELLSSKVTEISVQTTGYSCWYSSFQLQKIPQSFLLFFIASSASPFVRIIGKCFCNLFFIGNPLLFFVHNSTFLSMSYG